MIIPFLFLAIGAYLLGSVPAAYLAVKWSRGIDIRKVGTGKVGASNVLRAGPKWLVIPVAIFDIGKASLSVWIAQQIGLNAPLQVTAGLCAVVGHNWPIFLRFKSGGRGIFASLGVITMLSWKLGIIMLVVPYLFAPIKQVALGVFLALAALPFLSYFLAQSLDIKEKIPITLGFVALTTMALLKRLITHRTELSKGAPLGVVLLNRLFFDRDIGNRRLWVSRKPAIKQ
jgi:acyl phosphate:glycerol-3-phosphate acyltransferase